MQLNPISAAIARYYAEFLTSDFKTTSSPRRSIQRKAAKGMLVGIPLKRYPKAHDRLQVTLGQPESSQKPLSLKRGSHRAQLAPLVQGVVTEAVSSISDNLIISTVIGQIIDKAVQLNLGRDMDIELYREVFIERTTEIVGSLLVEPTLKWISEHLSNNSSNPIDELSVHQKELSERLVALYAESCVPMLSQVVLSEDTGELKSLILDVFAPSRVKWIMTDYFETLIASDLYMELMELSRAQKMTENSELFLYIGAISIKGSSYPFAFQRLRLTEEAGKISFTLDNQLYINKQAIDYAVDQVNHAEDNQAAPSIVKSRIFYLDSDQSAYDLLQPLLVAFCDALNLGHTLDLSDECDSETLSISGVSIGHQLSIALGDKPEESILNDYETLLSGLPEHAAVADRFESMVDAFLHSNPVSTHLKVETDWELTPIEGRLVYPSPLPLVEEQRKIISALELPETRYIAVEGPPGTGKSHTISAIAFNAIRRGQKLLILSDKKEALDVVEDKLDSALSRVRHKDNFQNPILRLGRGVGNYNQLLRKTTIDSLELARRMSRKQDAAVKENVNRKIAQLRKSLEQAALASSALTYDQIEETVTEAANLYQRCAQFKDSMYAPDTEGLLSDYTLVLAYLNDLQKSHSSIAMNIHEADDLRALLRVGNAIRTLPHRPTDLPDIRYFRFDKLDEFKELIKDLENARGIMGYLFAGKKLQAISKALYAIVKVRYEQPQHILPDLSALAEYIDNLASILERHKLRPGKYFDLAFELLGDDLPPAPPVAVIAAADRIEAYDVGDQQVGTLVHCMKLNIGLGVSDDDLVGQFIEVRKRLIDLDNAFSTLNETDYLCAKASIEEMCTQLLASEIDDRLINFYHQRRADAKTLGDIIRRRSRFPTEKFGLLQEAFPCIIAGLRDYAEYIPMEEDLFDLIIIDEASQVSIAQALPAIIRAKKMLILGDPKQFGNVKTGTASKAINNAYLDQLRQTLAQSNGKADSYALSRLERFDIKSSVMDFFDLIANYSIQLKKHFRSYPEMIAFSSQHFYDESLQVMKIRGRELSEVIQFHPIKHDGSGDKDKNINEQEAVHIIACLEKILDTPKPMSAGIITPHTEQAAYISRLVEAHPRYEEMIQRLRLKVMNFDSCQGEERDVIFYSLVATSAKDRLAHIFPASITDNAREVEFNLRLQRLNVGFSRAKERIVIVHSKPIDDYKSAIRSVLFFYRAQLEKNIAPKAGDPRYLHKLLSETDFYQELEEYTSVTPNFPLGAYLNQLSYDYVERDHTECVLLTIQTVEGQRQVIVEYEDLEGNHLGDQLYRSATDIECELTLESFGVKLLRVNSMTLGLNPKEALNDQLRASLGQIDVLHSGVSESLRIAKDHAAMAEEGLNDGSYLHCKKCDEVKSKEHFINKSTKSGFGRYCVQCRR